MVSPAFQGLIQNGTNAITVVRQVVDAVPLNQKLIVLTQFKSAVETEIRSVDETIAQLRATLQSQEAKKSTLPNLSKYPILPATNNSEKTVNFYYYQSIY